jgi:cytoskeleton protein RodZ
VILLLLAALAVYFIPQIQQTWQSASVGLAKGTAPPPVQTNMVQQPVPSTVQTPVEVANAADAHEAKDAPVVSTAPAAAAPTAAVPASPTYSVSVAGATAPVQTEAAPPTSAPEVEVLRIRATLASWVEVTDSTGRLRIQRLVAPGEEVGFAGGAPYAVVVGKADGVQVTLRGQPLDLGPLSKSNVARFQAK